MKNSFDFRSQAKQTVALLVAALLTTPQLGSGMRQCCTMDPDPDPYCVTFWDCPDQDDPPECETCPPTPGSHSANPSPGTANSGSSAGSPGTTCQGCSVTANGMPYYWVSEPNINLRIEDRPWGYQPGRGGPVSFQMSYRQRGVISFDPNIFNVGTNWSCSFRSFVIAATNTDGVVSIYNHKGGAGRERYHGLNTAGLWSGKAMSLPQANTCVAQLPDGSTETFSVGYTNSQGSRLLFLSQRTDPQGNTLTFNYVYTGGGILLSNIVDADGFTNNVYYTTGNRIDHITDRFGRTCYLYYDATGTLTNITDVQGLASTFAYGDYGITNLTTPYGSTGFEHGGIAVADGSTPFYPFGEVSRYVRVTLPNGGHELYLYQHDASAFVASSFTMPTNTPLANTFDNGDQSQYNSYYWSALQYVHLSAADVNSLTNSDYAIGRQRHWLLHTSGNPPVNVLSTERAPSPDGTALGQVTWYDYAGKADPTQIGSTAQPLFVAQVLPSGETWFNYTARNFYGHVTNQIQTYTKPDSSVGLRTNKSIYYTGDIDLKQQIGPNNEQVVSNYVNNAYHQVDASYDALNQETKFTYNANRQLIKTVTPGGLTTTNIFLASGDSIYRLEKTIDLEIGRSNAFTYASGLVYSHTDERGLTTTNYWDNLQRLRGIRFPDNTTISNVYSDIVSPLDITARKDRLTNWTYYGYNEIRQKLAETNANGVITRYGYCDCGALMSVTNAWNTPVQFVTQYDYDKSGNRVLTYLPDATITNWFDALGRVIATGDGAANTWFAYNNQGLLTTNTTANGKRQITVYDIEDRPIYVTDANSVTITNTYDELGRLRTRTYPDTGVEAFGYSARGLVAYTNQIGATNFYAYDEAGRKTFDTNANWELIRYTNSPAGDLVALVDGKNQVTKWNYDEYGRVTNKLDQAGTEILRYTYDAASRLASRWSAAKGTTYYTNDAVGNLTKVNYPASPDVTLGYDALNRVTNMVDAVGTTLYGYALGGQLETEDGPWSSDTVTNTYLNRLRVRMDLQQPTGVWTNKFTYDASRRLTNVTSKAGSFGYLLASGAPSTLTVKLLLPNTSYITNAYDSVARLRFTKLNNSSHGTLSKAEYGYNAANQRTTFTNVAGTYVQYTNDPIGQLRIANSSINTEDRGYQYDAAWNLNYRTNNGVTTTVAVDGLNQLSSFGTGTCAYDSNGNLTNSHAGRRVYVYDDENRLQELYVNTITGNPDKATEFVYDGLGRLRIRKEYTYNPPGFTGGDNWTLTAEVRYVYYGWRVIQERDGSNGPQVSYTRGTDLSGTLEGAGGIGGLLARSHGYSSGTGNWSTHNFYHADGNGNITYLETSAQGLAATYRYDPYGNLISSSGTLANGNVYRFSSKEVHTLSGLYYYGYRFYEPNFQRWVNRDPIGEVGGINLFQFVFNTPINEVDWMGLIVEDPPEGIGFTYADVMRAVNLADKCGVKGPDGKTMLQMFTEMVKSDKKLKWKKWKGQPGKQVPQTAHDRDTGKPQDATIHFPKCDPDSCKADIASSTNKKYNFDAAIMHELMHAYEAMTGTYDPTAPETLASRVGNAVQGCIDNCNTEKGK